MTVDGEIDFNEFQWAKNMAPEDIKEIIELSQLSLDEIHLQITKLLKTAYILGILESREIIRGKYLGIYHNSKKRMQQ